MRLILRRHGWSVAASVTVLLAYVFVLSSMPKHVFWSPDEGGKFLELHSMQWHGGLTYIVPYAGQRIDPTFRFYPHVSTPNTDTFPYPVSGPQGTVRFHWPIWFPLLSGCMLRAFGLTGIYIIPLLSGWLIALISGRIAHALNPRLASLTIMLVGFATPVAFYSQCFWEHTLAAALGLLAVAILVMARRGSIGSLIAMTPPLFAAMMLRIEMLAFAAAALLAWALSVAVIRLEQGKTPPRLAAPSGKRWLSLLLLCCVAVAILAVVVATMPARQQHFIATLPARVAGSLHKLPHMPRSIVSVFINTGRDEGPAASPAWVILACIAVGVCFVAPFVTPPRAEAAVIVPALAVTLAFGASAVFLYHPYRALHGIFPVAPFMVIWLYALPDGWRQRDPTLLMLAGFAVLYLIIGCAAIFIFYVDAEGGLLTGLEWGQRYLLTLYPILTILSVVALDGYWQSTRSARLKTAVTILVSALMLIGIQQEIRGLSMLRSNRQVFAAWDRALRTEGPIVTDLWWLPTALAPLFLAHEMSYVASRTDLTDWVRLAAAQEIPGFTFVSLAPVQNGPLGRAGVPLMPRDSRSVFGLYLTRFDLAPPLNPPAVR